MLDPKVGSVIRGELEIIDRMEMLDDYTLRMTLKDKYYPLPAMFTNRWLPILDPQTFETAKEHPIATGAVQVRLLETPARDRHGPATRGTGNATPTATRLPYLDEVIGKPLADDTGAPHRPCAPARWT